MKNIYDVIGRFGFKMETTVLDFAAKEFETCDN